jgi:SAM-dependent methyltransferase
MERITGRVFGRSSEMRQRSEELDLGRYDTDKIPNGYLRIYDRFFEALIDRPVRLLEIGVFRGGSLRLWRDYFPKGIVAGLDLEPIADIQDEERLRIYQGRQEDMVLLSRIAAEVAPDGFDIIIDDASHIAAPTRKCFWHLFDHHLKSGGLFVIEDWGTGYWRRWPDGRAWRAGKPHYAGMVGFIKELVDEQAAHDVTREWYDEPPKRSSRFESICLFPSIAIVTRTALPPPSEPPTASHRSWWPWGKR